MEKRFAYIRKHYDRVSKKLTITDDLARDDGPFSKCPGTDGRPPRTALYTPVNVCLVDDAPGLEGCTVLLHEGLCVLASY